MISNHAPSAGLGDFSIHIIPSFLPVVSNYRAISGKNIAISNHAPSAGLGDFSASAQ
jgi:hypothetical protein